MTERKKRIIYVSIAAAVLLAAALYVGLHAIYLYAAGEEIGLYTIALHIIRHPLQFPSPSDAAFPILSVAMIVLAFLLITYATVKLKEHDDINTVLGDATFMDAKALARFQRDMAEPIGSPEMSGNRNFIMSDDIYLSMDTKKTRTALNVMMIGGTGRGKSFNFVGPNILQMNASFLITDPSGDLYSQYAAYLEYHGYRIKVFNLYQMDRSDHYNPFKYITCDKDIQVLVSTLITNTTDPHKTGGDDFWVKSEQALLNALIAYCWHYEDEDRKNFARVLELIRMADISEEGDNDENDALDNLFSRVPESDRFTRGEYQSFKIGAGKTLKSILISAAIRLQGFDLKALADLTSTDDIGLDRICDVKTALFVVIPTGETTYNYMAGIMYTQLFQLLYGYCEGEAYGSYLIKSGDEVLMTIRPSDHEDAEERLEAMKDSRVVKSDRLSLAMKDGSTVPIWEIRDSADRLICYRGDEQLARKECQAVRSAHIEHHGKRSCPVHVRFILDEFANTGKIPDFVQRLSTVRKYEISCTIILQSLTQIQQLYDKEWSAICSNCPTTIYLGGGLDGETQEWLSKAMGMHTVKVMNQSFNGDKGGGQTINLQGVELFSRSSMRTMDRSECIVIVDGFDPYKGPMYNTLEHPDWGLKESFAQYRYDQEMKEYIANEMGDGVFGRLGEEELKEQTAQEPEEDKSARQNAPEPAPPVTSAPPDSWDFGDDPEGLTFTTY